MPVAAACLSKPDVPRSARRKDNARHSYNRRRPMASGFARMRAKTQPKLIEEKVWDQLKSRGCRRRLIMSLMPLRKVGTMTLGNLGQLITKAARIQPMNSNA